MISPFPAPTLSWQAQPLLETLPMSPAALRTAPSEHKARQFSYWDLHQPTITYSPKPQPCASANPSAPAHLSHPCTPQLWTSATPSRRFQWLYPYVISTTPSPSGLSHSFPISRTTQLPSPPLSGCSSSIHLSLSPAFPFLPTPSHSPSRVLSCLHRPPRARAECRHDQILLPTGRVSGHSGGSQCEQKQRVGDSRESARKAGQEERGAGFTPFHIGQP